MDFFPDKIQAYTEHKIVEECITSHRLNKNVHHNIFFIDKYFFHEFSTSFDIFLKFYDFSRPGKKKGIFQVFHDA